MIKVLINGSLGKMGQATIKAVEADLLLETVAKTDKDDDLAKVIAESKAEVIVDFTVPDNRMNVVKAICQNKARGVIGTTGFTKADLNQIDIWCKEYQTAVLIAPNFAIGAVLMMQFAKTAFKYMPKAEIIELHHDQKLDAPSGTALKTKELMGSEDIPIHSVRLPGFVANQEVIFGGLAQTLTIKHDTLSRESFMPGVLVAIKEIVQRDGLIYGLEHILKL